MRLPNQAARALARYRRVLPTSEYAALGAWAATFHPFQRAWLFDTADVAICNKSRQIGTSHTTSGVGVLWGAFHGELTTIISIGDRQSVEVLEKARKHALILQGLGSQWARFGPLPAEIAAPLNERFQRACRRFYDSRPRTAKV